MTPLMMMLGQENMFHNFAFEKLKQYIDTGLVEKEGAEFLSSLHNRYKEHLNESDTSYSAQSLSLKIMKNYEGVLCLHKSTNKIGIIIHSVKLTTGQAIKRAKFDDNAIAEVAMLLRKDILHMSKHQEELPETLSAESLHRGQGHILETLHQFFTVLYTGSDQQPDIEKIKRLVQSVSQDVIYATTRGRTKPGKHLTLGLGL